MNVNVDKQVLLEQAQKAVNIDQLNKLIENIIDTVLIKNHDYGNAWQRYGIFTPLIRINDKTLRLKTLAGGEQALVADERVEDTLRDIVGYGLLALLYLDVNGDNVNTQKFVEMVDAFNKGIGKTIVMEFELDDEHFISEGKNKGKFELYVDDMVDKVNKLYGDKIEIVW